jgi:hypothetical protein
VGIEQVQGVHRGRNSARRASSQCAGKHRGEENSLSSVILKEESTEGSSLGC